MSKKIIFIVGPTASGKTEVALLLARALSTEIISCDAMQVYREISILTAKPSAEVLEEVPHHLINTVSVAQDFDVASFRRKVLKAIAVVERKKKIPLIVGGSGLYMAILLDGIFDERRQMSRVKTRQHILEKIQAQGLASAYARLRDVDPVYAAKIHPHDQRRIVRALEVYDLYGTPMSLLQKKRTGLWHTHQVSVFALSWERSVLYERINKRVDNMFAEGAIDEVRALFRKKISRTAQGIIGLKEIQLLLEGQMTESQAKEMIKRHTRHYAKRQLTWFRKDQRLNWMDIRTQERPAEVARRILHRVRNDG